MSGEPATFLQLLQVAGAVLKMVTFIEAERKAPPPVQFVSGVGTSLTELAEASVRLAGTAAEIHHVGPRSFDVNGFVGSGERARQLLGWQTKTSIEEGLAHMVRAFADANGKAQLAEPACGFSAGATDPGLSAV